MNASKKLARAYQNALTGQGITVTGVVTTANGGMFHMASIAAAAVITETISHGVSWTTQNCLKPLA